MLAHTIKTNSKDLSAEIELQDIDKAKIVYGKSKTKLTFFSKVLIFKVGFSTPSAQTVAQTHKASLRPMKVFH